MAMRMVMRSAGLMRSMVIICGGNSGSRTSMYYKRSFSSAQHDDAYETAKWEKITYLGIAACTLIEAYNLSKGHLHCEEPPAYYSYLHIRNKEFPWGPDGLFETKKHTDH